MNAIENDKSAKLDPVEAKGLVVSCLQKTRKASARSLSRAGKLGREALSEISPDKKTEFKEFYDSFIREAILGAARNTEKYVSNASAAAGFLSELNKNESVEPDAREVELALGDRDFLDAGEKMEKFGLEASRIRELLRIVAEATALYVTLTSAEANARTLETAIADSEVEAEFSM